MDIKEGSILQFNTKVDCIKEGLWVVTRINHPKNKKSFVTLGVKGVYKGIGCLSMDLLKDSLEKELITICGYVSLKNTDNKKKSRKGK